MSSVSTRYPRLGRGLARRGIGASRASTGWGRSRKSRPTIRGSCPPCPTCPSSRTRPDTQRGCARRASTVSCLAGPWAGTRRPTSRSTPRWARQAALR
ncbi:MAG TPA: oxidoreductase [Candidatus Hydrogenedentes bacterium]|nr:oxidoreductase [Candidatus Hydrogenedentota bacterium]